MAHARAMILGLVLLVAAPAAMADPEPANSSDFISLYGSFNAEGGSSVRPHVGKGEGGYIKNLIAPAGTRFRNDAAADKNANTPGTSATAFLDAHKSAFGIKTDRVEFDVMSVESDGDGATVRIRQTYDDVPVLGGEFIVRLDSSSDITAVLSDPMRDSNSFDNGFIGTTPSRDAATAEQDAITSLVDELGPGEYQATPPEVVIYDPEIVGTAGEPRLAYITQVHDGADHLVDHEVFVDAHSGDVLLSYSLMCTAKTRYVYDLQGRRNTPLPGELARVEGQPPTGIGAVDLAYEWVGDTYDFYQTEHNRMGIFGLDLPILTSVRLGDDNAFWTGRQMVFGTKFLSDDIVAHEYTHGVTDAHSNLRYLFESGAINESLSDIWGEFVDFANGSADDIEETRWFLGEGSLNGPIRYMADPTLFGDPDRYSALVELPIFIDNGGVHINSGIGNKLCYLLTDGTGDFPFNGVDVESMGESRVADLFYRAQTTYLMEFSNYEDLYFALIAAAEDEGWSFQEIQNLQAAAAGVEIFTLPDGKSLRHLRAQSESGTNNITLTWKNPTYPFVNVTLVRNTTRFPESSADGQILLQTTTATSFVDNNVTGGTQYFYGIFATFDEFAIEADFAQATVGEGLPQYTAEIFDSLSPTDLSFKQILYSPVGDLGAAFATSAPSEYVTFHHYSATVKSNVQQLPIRRVNGITLNLPDDNRVTIPQGFVDQPIFFFGRLLNRFQISGNGFISPADVITQHFLNQDELLTFPSVESHWDIPRISFLFKDLVPASSGEIWIENLPDRVVVTFENIRQRGGQFPPPENTAQVELFYSGHIRVTYQSVESTTLVAGLSDGRGVPIAPSDINSAEPVPLSTDLDTLPEAGALSINPIPASIVSEGDLVAFIVSASSSSAAPIVLSIDNEPTGSTFDASTGVFSWRTDAEDDGVYQPVFTATQGSAMATQSPLIIVNDLGLAPSASDAVLAPAPTVEDDQEIVLSYVYSSPDSQSELGTEIFWYRNGFLVSALYNSLLVPPIATEVGDLWSAALIPQDSRGLRGEPVFSEEVSVIANTKSDINEDGATNAIDIQLVINAVLGKGLGALNPDANIDGDVNSVDIQTVINKVLN